MQQLITATPEQESINVDLADQIYTQAIEHCINNIDNQIINKGINKQKNLFYGRYYNKQAYMTEWLRPPFRVLDEKILVNKDVYFIRSSDITAANKLPYFTICICFIQSGDNQTLNGTYSSMVENQPTICLFVQIHIRYMTNWMFVKEGFQKLLLLFTKPRSTFVHEFTHMLDDQKYDIGKQHKKSKNTQEYARVVDYINLNHEINARYMQIIHEILSTIDQIPGTVERGIGQTFPNFQTFFDRFCLGYGTVYRDMVDYLSKYNEKRIKTRLYLFYRYLIAQEIKHSDLDKQAANQFANEQILEDKEIKYV